MTFKTWFNKYKKGTKDNFFLDCYMCCYEIGWNARYEEIQSLKDQVERMKCCYNCAHQEFTELPQCKKIPQVTCEKWSL